jgi:ATP-binding cassette subfamily B protein
MTGGLSIKLSGSVMDLLLPWILAHMIDDVVPSKNVTQICLWGGAMVLCSIIGIIGNTVANRMAASVARDVVLVMRRDLFVKILGLTCAQIDIVSIPSLISRLTSDTNNVHRMVSSMQRIGVRAPFLMLGGVIVTLTLEPFLTLVLIGTLPFICAVILLVSRWGIPLYTASQAAADRMVRVARENLVGIRVIKALSKEDYEKKRFARTNLDVTRLGRKAGIVMGVTNPAMSLLLNAGCAAVILAGGYRVESGLTQTGEILAFLTYFSIILNATMSITRVFTIYSKGNASANRIAEILSLRGEMELSAPNRADSSEHISFHDVSFSYGKQRPALEGISFSLKRGETLGVLGETGCGKSTIVNLLLRFYDLDSGLLRIGGEDIRGIPQERLYAMFGVTFQNDTLFSRTIRENIAFGRDLSDGQIRDAARYAQAMNFIETLDGNFSHRLTSRGVNLSGGQRQRVLIARAMAGKPEILILDDSSSALDYNTDANLRRALDENFAGVTKIIIAQRISSIMYADRILLLENGRVAGYGEHGELAASSALYRDILQSQIGGGAEFRLPKKAVKDGI